ncbi:MAG: hypothetical protein C7B43_00955 [Sulfobacillus benefaciens]|uniref:Fibronectin type-III domain-containing protein n=1 Tax=Sulfobacillus benefaciens TaxID=453960 RepID=A0A2T2XBF0_9FIRM|nr:MAG: hypothetical protein C7B43_00955 [Sulfobacillus benefaciens]
MINISRKRTWAGWRYIIVAAVLMVLLPLAFVVGWLSDLSQVRPVLAELGHAQQTTAKQSISSPEEPPGNSPQNIHVTWGSSKVVLMWPRVSGASTYTIYRSQGDQGFSHAKTLAQVSQSANLIEFVDLSVKPDRRYTYWIASGNKAGQGPVSQPHSGQTFLSTAAIIRRAEEAATLVQGHLWSRGGMGLFAPVDHVQSAIAYNINKTLYAPMYFSPFYSHSTWLTRRWITWTTDHTRIGAIKTFHHLTLLRGPGASSRLSSLVPGNLSSNDVVVWHAQGHWQHETFSGPVANLPADAVVLNGYGQAWGVSNASGHFVPALHEKTNSRPG